MIRLRDPGDTAPNLTSANSKLSIIGLIWLILTRIIAHRFSAVSFCLVVGFWSVAPQNVRRAIPLRLSCVGSHNANQNSRYLQKTLSRLMLVSRIHLTQKFQIAVTFSVVDRFWIRVAHDDRREILFRLRCASFDTPFRFSRKLQKTLFAIIKILIWSFLCAQSLDCPDSWFASPYQHPINKKPSIPWWRKPDPKIANLTSFSLCFEVSFAIFGPRRLQNIWLGHIDPYWRDGFKNLGPSFQLPLVFEKSTKNA